MASSRPRVIFVLGGPGSGKSTQCKIICENFSFIHLSVGDLLREEAKSGSELGLKIHEVLSKGLLVPPEISLTVLLNAMSKGNAKRFLVDGFPRIEKDRIAFEQMTGVVPDLVLYYDCPQEELLKRLMQRVQIFLTFLGLIFFQKREDGTEEAIKERLHLFHKETLPTVDYYEDQGLLRRVNAGKEVERVYNSTKNLFAPYLVDELLEVSQQLLDGIDVGDYATYERLCDPELTAFEPEAQGQLVEKLPFHKFYFGIRGSGSVQSRFSTIAAPRVTMLSEDAAMVTYTRLMQERGIKLIGFCDSYNETRVWKRKRLSSNTWEWRHIHFHRSKGPTDLGHTCVDI